MSASRPWPSLADVRAAIGILTTVPLGRADPRSLAFARASLLFPVIGLLIGTILLALGRLIVPQLGAALGAVLLVLSWEALGGVAVFHLAARAEGGDPHGAGHALLIAAALAKLGGLAAQLDTHTAALFFPPLLGRWAIVVLATGARDVGAPNRKLNPAITFREFALTSIFTFAVCFAVAEFAGVLLVVSAAGFSLLLRLLLHRWPGGVSGRSLWVGCASVEALVVILLLPWGR